jgi:hypothetical protein
MPRSILKTPEPLICFWAPKEAEVDMNIQAAMVSPKQEALRDTKTERYIDLFYNFIDNRQEEGFIFFSRKFYVHWPVLLCIAIIFAAAISSSIPTIHLVKSM